MLKWIVDRIEHQAGGQDTAIGVVPSAGDLDLDGLDVDAADVAAALAVNAAEWREELPLIEEWLEFVGDKLPTGVKDEFEALKQRLARGEYELANPRARRFGGFACGRCLARGSVY